MTKRLLFIVYYFPPIRAVATVRGLAIAKHLSRLGWQVTILTPAPGVWRVADNVKETEDSLLKEGIVRITTGHSLRCLHPEELRCWNKGLGYVLGGILRKVRRGLGLERELGWFPHALRACGRFKPGDFDLVLASGGPWISFSLARRIAARLECQFVVDYRDLWNGNAHKGDRKAKSALNRERKILNSCAKVIAVSPSLSEHISRAFRLGEKPVVVSNGFDLEDFRKITPATFGHFAIVYAGIFYPPLSTIAPLMEVLQRLKQAEISGSPGWRFHYYGRQTDHVREKAVEWDVLDKVTIHGNVPRSEALSAIRGANVAVVVVSLEQEAPPEQRGIVTGKVFEAVGLGTPVLLIAPKGSDASIVINATSGGGHFTAVQTDEMASFLVDMMAGRCAKPRIPMEYSWDSLATRMDSVLRGTIEK
jgi:glycosyltransferase involved in cell wall biosynthesis